MRLILGLVLLGWLVEQRWLQALLAGIVAVGLAVAIRTLFRSPVRAEPEPNPWTRSEPRFEFSASGERDRGARTQNQYEEQAPPSSSSDENPFGDMTEEALAEFIAGLIRKNEALEDEVRSLRERVRVLEAETAAFPDRLRAASNAGRDRVLHAFGHDRDEFECMLRAFAQRERRRHEHARQRRQGQERQRTGTKRQWWEVLGVSRNATEEEVRRAYRSLAMKHHPDRSGTGDAERMAEINAARDEAMRRFRTAA